MRTIGKEKPTRTNLRRARVALGLTQTEMSARLGLSLSHYKNIETGFDDPSYKVMETFEAAFHDYLKVWDVNVWRIFKKFPATTKARKIEVEKDPNFIDDVKVKTDWKQKNGRD